MDAFRATDPSSPSPSPVADGQDLLVRASHEVDLSLLRWSLALSPRERLRAATRTARMLKRFHRAESS